MVKTLACPSCGGALDPSARACPHCGIIAASRRCGVCFEMNLIDGRSCRRCGKRLPREDPARRPERIPCPGCGAGMTPRKLDNTLFDECDTCGGLWLCPATIESVSTEAESRARILPFDLQVAQQAGAGAAAPSTTYRKCPLCSKHMNRQNYARRSGVIIDSCKEHGCYFDRGELAVLCDFIEGGGLERVRQREEEERRASESDARRKAILAGADPVEVGGRELDPFARFSGMDLLRLLGGLF